MDGRDHAHDAQEQKEQRTAVPGIKALLMKLDV